MLDAICAELDNVPGETVGLFSNDATLVLKLALGATNEPDIPVAVNDLISVAFAPNEPDIPDAVNPTAPPSSKNVTLVLNEELGATNDPEMPVFCANADKSWSPVLVPDKFDPMIVPSVFILPVADNDPVISELPFDWKPRFIINSFAIYSFLPYPKSIFI